MRHRKAGLKLSRHTGHLTALFRNLVTSLLKHDRIRTTDTKAKELRRWADHLVTLAKRGDLHARRQALSIVQEPAVVHMVFQKAAERFGTVSGGYTRLTKLGQRPGDAASMTLIELIGFDEEMKKKKKKAKKKTTSAAAGKKKKAAKAVPPAGDASARPVQPAEAESEKTD
jgi:large subunit ribosomal protein L17